MDNCLDICYPLKYNNLMGNLTADLAQSALFDGTSSHRCHAQENLNVQSKYSCRCQQ